MRRGRPMRRPIVVAATASGGATTAPIAKAAGQPRSGRSALTRTATPTVVKATRPTDSSRIDRRLALKSTRLVCSAAAYSSGGSRPKSTTSGSSCTSGTNGRYEPMTPTTIRTSGEGRSSLELRPATAMTTVTIPTSVRTTCMPSSSRMPLSAFPADRCGASLDELDALRGLGPSAVRKIGAMSVPDAAQKRKSPSEFSTSRSVCVEQSFCATLGVGVGVGVRLLGSDDTLFGRCRGDSARRPSSAPQGRALVDVRVGVPTCVRPVQALDTPHATCP